MQKTELLDTKVQSQFENYDVKASQYDKLRKPIDVQIIVDQLKDPKNSLVLDAGAGTGNYTFPLAKQIGKVVAFDINDGMIAQWTRKKELNNVQNAEMIQGSLFEPDNSDLIKYKGQFDLITIEMVIHHLDQDWENFPNFRNTCEKLYPYLKPGGKFIINHLTQENLRGIWFFNIHPKAFQKHAIRFAPREVMQQAFKDAGFVDYHEIKGTEQYFGLQYYNCHNPFVPEFRKTDSFFTDAEDYTEEYLEKLKAMTFDGTLPQFIADCEKIKQEFGFTTFVIGQKPQ